MKDKGDSVVFVLPGLTKTRSQKHPGCAQIDFRVFEPDSKLDVVQCKRDYIQRTQQWRISVQYHFLLATTKPHMPVVTSTISGWLVKVMEIAGLNVAKYKGHSVRSAATSKARTKGMSVADIMSRANWRHAGTFSKFYDRSTELRGDFGATVLSAR